MSKFDCPKCGKYSTISNVVVGKRETTRYRTCAVCHLHFATTETLKETPKLRQVLGEAKADVLWPKPPFKYRTIKQQKRAAKTST